MPATMDKTQRGNAPELVALFLEPRAQNGGFISLLLQCLAKEKAANFANVNRYLDGMVAAANRTLEELTTYQGFLEQVRVGERMPNLDRPYEQARQKGAVAARETQAAKARLDDLKIALCRFIVEYEAPARERAPARTGLEEWLDAATLAEMRLTRYLAPEGDKSLQKLLSSFMTFRSIVCSYEGPAVCLRQLESALASLESLYEKIKLELAVAKTSQKLVETSKELSTIKLDLSAIQSELQQKKRQAEQLTRLVSLQDRSTASKAAWLGLLAIAALGVAWLALFSGLRPSRPAAVISQNSCREIAEHIGKNPGYRDQVLVFRKFDTLVYFQANALTCQKLHTLDSGQFNALAGLLKDDYALGYRTSESFNGQPVLHVRDIGINKLAVVLMNHTENDLKYKLRVLEHAVNLRGALQPMSGTEKEDMVIIDLTLRPVKPSY